MASNDGSPPSCKVRDTYVDTLLVGNATITLTDVEFKLLFEHNEKPGIAFRYSNVLGFKDVDDKCVISYNNDTGLHTISMSRIAMEPEENWKTIVQILPALIQTPDEGIAERTKEQSNGIKEVPKQPTTSGIPRVLPQSFTSSSNAQRHLDAMGKKKPAAKIHTDLSSQAAKLESILSSTSSRSSTSENRAPNSSSQTHSSSSTSASGTSGARRNHGLVSTPSLAPNSHQPYSGRLSISHEPKESPLKSPATQPGNFQSFNDSISGRSRGSPATSSPAALSEFNGIRNTGNTCYINAVLQGLMSLGSFVSDLGSESLMELAGELGLKSFFRAFLAIADQSLEADRKTALDPSRVKLAVARHSERFRDNEQQDAHEFLLSCLSQLEQDLVPILNAARKKQQEAALRALQKKKKKKRSKKSEKMEEEAKGGADNDAGSDSAEFEFGPAVDDGIPFSERKTMLDPSKRNFAGVLQTKITCKSCDDVSYNYESIRCLTLDVFETTEDVVTHIISNLRGPTNPDTPVLDEDVIREKLTQRYKSPLTISQLLDIYFISETIERRCEKCDHKISEIRRGFVQLPRVLVIHLKRFSYNFESHRFSKLKYPIKVSPRVNLEKFCSQDISCSGPIPFLQDFKGTLMRSKRRIQALPEEEKQLKKMIQKDRAEKKRKRADTQDDLDLLAYTTTSTHSATTLRSKNVQTRTNISDSSTSVSFDAPSLQTTKKSQHGAYDASRGLHDETSPEYQDLLSTALSTTVGAPSSRKHKCDLNLSDDDILKPVSLSKRPKLSEDTSSQKLDSSTEFDIDISLISPEVAEVVTVSAADKSATESVPTSPSSTYSPSSLPSAFDDNFLDLKPTHTTEQANDDKFAYLAEAQSRATGGSASRGKTTVKTWAPSDKSKNGKGGLKGGAGPKKSAPLPAGIDWDLAEAEVDATSGEAGSAAMDESETEEGPNRTSSEPIDFDALPLSLIQKEFWKSVHEYINDETGTKPALTPVDLLEDMPVLSAPPKAAASSASPTSHQRLPIDSFSSNNGMSRGSFSVPKYLSSTSTALRPPTSTTSLSSASNTSQSTNSMGTGGTMSARTALLKGTKPVNTISVDDEQDEEMKKAMAESLAESERAERAKKLRNDEEDLAIAIAASKRDILPLNDYAMDGLFDSDDEREKVSYQRDEYEGDEVARLSDETQSLDPQRPPISSHYALQAIVHHIGLSANSGHYVADVRSDLVNHPSNASTSSKTQSANHRTWKTFDDAMVTPITEQEVLEKETTPYLLFYVCESIIPTKS